MGFGTTRLFTEPEQRGSGLSESPLLVLFALEVYTCSIGRRRALRYPSRRPATGGKSLPHISLWAPKASMAISMRGGTVSKGNGWRKGMNRSLISPRPGTFIKVFEYWARARIFRYAL